MSRPDLAEIVVVLDRSGSMEPIKRDTIGALNQFVSEQKVVPKSARFTLVQFNDQYEFTYDGVDLQSVEKLTEETYVTSGTTALLDAVCRTIDQIGERFSDMPESDRPGCILFAILTDGEENSSKEYNLKQTLSKIEHQQDVYGWEFLFLGVGGEGWVAGMTMDTIPDDQKYSVPRTGPGIREALKTYSIHSTKSRMGDS